MIELPRRRFLQCLVGLVAAPAVWPIFEIDPKLLTARKSA